MRSETRDSTLNGPKSPLESRWSFHGAWWDLGSGSWSGHLRQLALTIIYQALRVSITWFSPPLDRGVSRKDFILCLRVLHSTWPITAQ